MNAGMYILNGKTPVPETDLYKWGDWFQTADRAVRVDHLGEVTVSTVFLGLDHSWSQGEPVLFETMIFGGDRDQEMHRYSTWDEAEAGHQQIVKNLEAMP